jgi:tol-pal system protein YbgF
MSLLMTVGTRLPSRFSVTLAPLGFALLLAGCLAQEADLRKVKQELSGELATLDKQEKELHSSIKQARGDLDKLINDTRARLREDISNIREQELPRLQGKQEELDHRAGELRTKLDDVRTGMSGMQKRLEAIERIQHDQTEVIKTDRDRGQVDREQSRDEQGKVAARLQKIETTLQLYGQKVDERLDAQDKAIASGQAKLAEGQAKLAEGLAQRIDGQNREFAGSLGEFRHALEKFKAVMVELEGRANKSDERVHLADQRTKDLSAAVDRDEKATTKHLSDVNKSIASITKTVETLGDRLSIRDQEQDRRLDEMNKYVASIVKTVETVGDKLTARVQEQDQRLDELGKGLVAVNSQMTGMTQDHGALRHKPETTPVPPSARGQKSVGPAPTELPREVRTEPAPPSADGQSAQVAAGTQDGASAAPVPPAKEVSPAASSGRDVYEEVYQKFRQGNLDAARQGFTDFLVLYPSSDLAPNAQYWLGECFYGRKDFKRAIDAFGRVRTAYPTSEKVPAAMLKEGFAYLALKDPKRGSTLLKQVVHGFPKSPEAGKASAKLSQLRVSP